MNKFNSHYEARLEKAITCLLEDQVKDQFKSFNEAKDLLKNKYPKSIVTLCKYFYDDQYFLIEIGDYPKVNYYVNHETVSEDYFSRVYNMRAFL